MARSRRRKWLSLFLMLAGMLFQAAPVSCQDLGTLAGASLTTAVTNAFIRNTVYNAFGLDASGLTGLGT